VLTRVSKEEYVLAEMVMGWWQFEEGGVKLVTLNCGGWVTLNCGGREL